MTRLAPPSAVPPSGDAEWMLRAKCSGMDPELWFGETAPQRARGMHVCLEHCEVMMPCYERAKESPPLGGVAGGVQWNMDGRPSAFQTESAAGCQLCPPPPKPVKPFDVGKCGTWAGYLQHLNRKGVVCPPCRAAQKQRTEASKQRIAATRAAALAARPT